MTLIGLGIVVVLGYLIYKAAKEQAVFSAFVSLTPLARLPYGSVLAPGPSGAGFAGICQSAFPMPSSTQLTDTKGAADVALRNRILTTPTSVQASSAAKAKR